LWGVTFRLGRHAHVAGRLDNDLVIELHQITRSASKANPIKFHDLVELNRSRGIASDLWQATSSVRLNLDFGSDRASGFGSSAATKRYSAMTSSLSR
jgi:hypothetical protein